MGRTCKEDLMAKYLLLKHYRGGPAPVVDVAPMDQWTPDEVDAHLQFMRDFATRLEETGEFVDAQALTYHPAIRSLESRDRAVQLAGELSAAPGPGGKPIHEWLEVRPFMTESLTATE
jgi:hypothetical protein